MRAGGLMAMTTAFQAVYPGSNPGRRIFYIIECAKHTKVEKINNKTKGYVVVGVGFIMILVTALGYLLNWERNFSAIFIIGLVAVAVGLGWTRK